MIRCKRRSRSVNMQLRERGPGEGHGEGGGGVIRCSSNDPLFIPAQVDWILTFARLSNCPQSELFSTWGTSAVNSFFLPGRRCSSCSLPSFNPFSLFTASHLSIDVLFFCCFPLLRHKEDKNQPGTGCLFLFNEQMNYCRRAVGPGSSAFRAWRRVFRPPPFFSFTASFPSFCLFVSHLNRAGSSRFVSICCLASQSKKQKQKTGLWRSRYADSADETTTVNGSVSIFLRVSPWISCCVRGHVPAASEKNSLNSFVCRGGAKPSAFHHRASLLAWSVCSHALWVNTCQSGFGACDIKCLY